MGLVSGCVLEVSFGEIKFIVSAVLVSGIVIGVSHSVLGVRENKVGD